MTAFLMVASFVSAITLNPGERLISVDGVPVAQQQRITSQPATAPRRGGLAQMKANRMARSGRMAHLGGGFGGGHAEGVGTGSSRESAIRNCCYWGRRTPIDIGAASNGRRWFACVIYR